jgi:hypothetical protein
MKNPSRTLATISLFSLTLLLAAGRSASAASSPIVLSASTAWLSGQWSQTTVANASYNVTPANTVQSSLADFHYVFSQSGWYTLSLQVPAIPKLATHVRYMVRIGDRHREFFLDQSGRNGKFVEAITFHAFANEPFTLTMVNATEREATAGAIEFTPRPESAINLSGSEGDQIAVNCPKGESVQYLRGIFGDLGSDAMCSFDRADAEVSGNSGVVRVGNQLCGDPAWGVHKQVEISVICAK